MIYSILGSFLGIIIALLWKARNYIIANNFNFKLWVDDNIVKFVWSIIVVSVLNVIFTYYPQSTEFMQFIGINIDVNDDISQNLSPVLLGVMVLFSVYDFTKTDIILPEDNSENDDELIENVE